MGGRGNPGQSDDEPEIAVFGRKISEQNTTPGNHGTMCMHRNWSQIFIGNTPEQPGEFGQQILGQSDSGLFFQTQRRDVAFLKGGRMLGDTQFHTSPQLFCIPMPFRTFPQPFRTPTLFRTFPHPFRGMFHLTDVDPYLPHSFRTPFPCLLNFTYILT